MQKGLKGLATSIGNEGKHDKIRSDIKQGSKGRKDSFLPWTTQLLSTYSKAFC